MSKPSITYSHFNARAIGSEVVFDEKFERSFEHCFRFVIKAYMHYKGIELADVVRHCKDRSYEAFKRSLTSYAACAKHLSPLYTEYFAKSVKVPLQYFVKVAEAFKDAPPHYNTICFKSDGSVKFLRAFYMSFDKD